MLQPASIKDRMATLRRHTSSSSDGGGSALPRTTILHLNVRPIEGVKWSTIQVQKSKIVDSEGEAPISGLRFTCNRHPSRPDSRSLGRHNAPRAHRCRFAIQSARNQTRRSSGRVATHWEKYL